MNYNEALFEQLRLLKKVFDLKGIKAEFEAEGATYEDVVRLRAITAALDIKLYLKIGGVEAVRDVKDGMHIGVDGFIAPMVESGFGAGKFISTLDRFGITDQTHVTFNIETIQGVKAAPEIIREYGNRVDNITIGRSDLSGSYENPNIVPDSSVIFDDIKVVSRLLEDTDITLTVGGSLSNASRKLFNIEHSELAKKIYKLETRKVILPTAYMLSSDEAIKQSLVFEKLWLESQINLQRIQNKELSERFEILDSRL